MNPTTLLIDFDFNLFRSASAVQQELMFDADTTVITGSFSEGKKLVKRELENLYQRFDTNKVLLCFTDIENFRKDIDPDYKGNRVGKMKPAGYKKLKLWAMETYPSLIKPGLEADDVCGIVATNGSLENFVLVSPDKDLLQIPCRIYNYKDEFTQSPEDAERHFYFQCLTGDQSDNYPGAKGCGPVKANKILDQVKDGDYWSAVLAAFEKAGQTPEDALRNLRLARILQASDWDGEHQKPILFNP